MKGAPHCTSALADLRESLSASRGVQAVAVMAGQTAACLWFPSVERAAEDSTKVEEGGRESVQLRLNLCESSAHCLYTFI